MPGCSRYDLRLSRQGPPNVRGVPRVEDVSSSAKLGQDSCVFIIIKKSVLDSKKVSALGIDDGWEMLPK